MVANRQGSVASGAARLALEPTELFPAIPNLYEFPSVHSDMIFDEQRVRAYERAIKRIVKSGDVVVDVGTGTGLLAFLCVRAGASRVHAIERSPIIECARKLAAANGLTDRIVFHYGDSCNIDLGEPVDIIISELIGHIAFEEGMIEAIFDAKQRFLKSTGIIIPQSVTLFAAPVCERNVYPSAIDCWTSAYGLDYSVMRQQALGTSYVTEIGEADLLSPQQPILSVSFIQDAPPPLNNQCRFMIHRTGEVNGIAFWFDSVLTDYVHLSSGPWAKTHWLQCFTPLSEPIAVSLDDVINVSVTLEWQTLADGGFKLCAVVAKGMSRGAQ